MRGGGLQKGALYCLRKKRRYCWNILRYDMQTHRSISQGFRKIPTCAWDVFCLWNRRVWLRSRGEFPDNFKKNKIDKICRMNFYKFFSPSFLKCSSQFCVGDSASSWNRDYNVQLMQSWRESALRSFGGNHRCLNKGTNIFRSELMLIYRVFCDIGHWTTKLQRFAWCPIRTREGKFWR